MGRGRGRAGAGATASVASSSSIVMVRFSRTSHAYLRSVVQGECVGGPPARTMTMEADGRAAARPGATGAFGGERCVRGRAVRARGAVRVGRWGDSRPQGVTPADAGAQPGVATTAPLRRRHGRLDPGVRRDDDGGGGVGGAKLPVPRRPQAFPHPPPSSWSGSVFSRTSHAYRRVVASGERRGWSACADHDDRGGWGGGGA